MVPYFSQPSIIPTSSLLAVHTRTHFVRAHVRAVALSDDCNARTLVSKLTRARLHHPAPLVDRDKSQSDDSSSEFVRSFVTIPFNCFAFCDVITDFPVSFSISLRAFPATRPPFLETN